jgi:hypothetical protein
MQECCKAWTDTYMMPYWDPTRLIQDSFEGMIVPKYCPLCRRKLHHTKDLEMEKDKPSINFIRPPYPQGKDVNPRSK